MTTLNPLLAAVAAPPIAEAQRWVEGRSFPADRPLIDLAQAVPGYAPPEALTAHLAERLRDPAVHRYTAILGLPELRAALAARFARYYGGAIGPQNLAITAGCNQAFCLAMAALARPGDQVVLPLPYYFNHRMWLDATGIEALHPAFRPDAGGVPDVDEVARLITDRTRAIVLVTPNNPTGAIYPAGTLRAFYDLAKRRGIALVLDETYIDFLPTDARPHDLFEDPDWGSTVVHLYSFSKVFAITGHRVGSITAGPALMAQVEKAMDCVAICAPRIGQEAALFGLERLGGWVQGNTASMRERATVFRAALSQLQGWRLVSLGAFFAYLEHPFPSRDAVAVARGLALEHNLLTLPGSMFGPGQDRFLRVAFANVGSDAAPVVADRLTAALASS
ncbi:aminotransferase [Inquilinus sp. Marseille-Q2685]|uniref:aminotransferase n=1 Tax=Inquilinus sp. Marseille-Q2685 TaxID=2866581 RepID=UPI001CE3C3E5|nr:aminotransferase [Inquilinus sp. Marseille-Q2685]